MYLMCMYVPDVYVCMYMYLTILKQLRLLVNIECLVGSSPFQQQLMTPLLLKLTCVATLTCVILYTYWKSMLMRKTS